MRTSRLRPGRLASGMGKEVQQGGRIRRCLERALALPRTMEDLKVWAGWLSKAWAWLLVMMPASFWVRGWLVDRILEVAVVGASVVVSAYGVRMLRAQARRPDPEVERLKALVPRIREARDTYYRNGPGEGLRFISLTVELAVHLEALGVLCPEEPETVNEADPWLRFLERLLPLAELGRLEEARTLRYRLTADSKT